MEKHSANFTLLQDLFLASFTLVGQMVNGMHISTEYGRKMHSGQ